MSRFMLLWFFFFFFFLGSFFLLFYLSWVFFWRLTWGYGIQIGTEVFDDARGHGVKVYWCFKIGLGMQILPEMYCTYRNRESSFINVLPKILHAVYPSRSAYSASTMPSIVHIQHAVGQDS